MAVPRPTSKIMAPMRLRRVRRSVIFHFTVYLLYVPAKPCSIQPKEPVSSHSFRQIPNDYQPSRKLQLLLFFTLTRLPPPSLLVPPILSHLIRLLYRSGLHTPLFQLLGCFSVRRLHQALIIIQILLKLNYKKWALTQKKDSFALRDLGHVVKFVFNGKIFLFLIRISSRRSGRKRMVPGSLLQICWTFPESPPFQWGLDEAHPSKGVTQRSFFVSEHSHECQSMTAAG